MPVGCHLRLMDQKHVLCVFIDKLTKMSYLLLSSTTCLECFAKISSVENYATKGSWLRHWTWTFRDRWFTFSISTLQARRLNIFCERYISNQNQKHVNNTNLLDFLAIQADREFFLAFEKVEKNLEKARVDWNYLVNKWTNIRFELKLLCDWTKPTFLTRKRIVSPL